MAEGIKDEIEADRASDQGNAADRRLTAILDVLLLEAVIVDPQKHRIVDANCKAAILIGSPVADMVGRVCHRFICPAAAGQGPITDLHQEIDHSERCVLNRAGESVPIIKTVKKIVFAVRIHLLGIFMDICAAVASSTSTVPSAPDNLPTSGRRRPSFTRGGGRLSAIGRIPSSFSVNRVSTVWRPSPMTSI